MSARIQALLADDPWLLLEVDTRTLHIVDPGWLSAQERLTSAETLVELLRERAQDPARYVRMELPRHAEDFVLRMLRKARGGKAMSLERWGNRFV
jgi:hypothetical protein